MKILGADKINQKIKRLAIEILEKNCDEQQIILAGLNNNGMHFATLLKEEIEKSAIINIEVIQTRISLNPANPTNDPIELDIDSTELANKVIIIVDDVANTGRTLQYAMLPFLKVVPKKIQIAVLVDRKHKSFPVHVDYVGLSLATTLKQNIDVKIRDIPNNERAVFLN